MEIVDDPDVQNAPVAERERITTLIVGARNLHSVQQEFGTSHACRILRGLGNLSDPSMAREVAQALANVLSDSDARFRMAAARELCKVIKTTRTRGSEEDLEALEAITADLGFHELVRGARAMTDTSAQAGPFVKLLAMVGDETAAGEVCRLLLGTDKGGNLKPRNWEGMKWAARVMKYLAPEDIVPVVCACSHAESSPRNVWMFAIPQILELAYTCRPNDTSHVKLARDTMLEFGFGIAAISRESHRFRLSGVQRVGFGRLQELRSALLVQSGLAYGQIGGWNAKSSGLKVVWKSTPNRYGGATTSEVALKPAGAPTTATTAGEPSMKVTRTISTVCGGTVGGTE